MPLMACIHPSVFVKLIQQELSLAPTTWFEYIHAEWPTFLLKV